MTLSMYAASVPIFVRSLGNMLAWLDKAEAHAIEGNFDPQNFLGLRLTADMLPLARQVQIASDAAKLCVARLAGVEAPKWADDESSLDELRERLRKTIAYAESIPAADIDGSEEREVVMPIGPDQSMTFTGQAYLTTFALPNFFFHVSVTYALLRQGGVALGKRDYLGMS